MSQNNTALNKLNFTVSQSNHGDSFFIPNEKVSMYPIVPMCVTHFVPAARCQSPSSYFKATLVQMPLFLNVELNNQNLPDLRY